MRNERRERERERERERRKKSRKEQQGEGEVETKSGRRGSQRHSKRLPCLVNEDQLIYRLFYLQQQHQHQVSCREEFEPFELTSYFSSFSPFLFLRAFPLFFGFFFWPPLLLSSRFPLPPFHFDVPSFKKNPICFFFLFSLLPSLNLERIKISFADVVSSDFHNEVL